MEPVGGAITFHCAVQAAVGNALRSVAFSTAAAGSARGLKTCVIRTKNVTPEASPEALEVLAPDSPGRRPRVSGRRDVDTSSAHTPVATPKGTVGVSNVRDGDQGVATGAAATCRTIMAPQHAARQSQER